MYRTLAMLYSGGHKGAEAAFGQQAEAHGIPEVTVSFQGHAMVREKNVKMLSDAELAKGDVSHGDRVAAYGAHLQQRREDPPRHPVDLPHGQLLPARLRHRLDPGRRHRQGRYRLGRRAGEVLQPRRQRLRPGPQPVVHLDRPRLAARRARRFPTRPSAAPAPATSRRRARRPSPPSSVARSTKTTTRATTPTTTDARD